MPLFIAFISYFFEDACALSVNLSWFSETPAAIRSQMPAIRTGRSTLELLTVDHKFRQAGQRRVQRPERGQRRTPAARSGRTQFNLDRFAGDRILDLAGGRCRHQRSFDPKAALGRVTKRGDGVAQLRPLVGRRRRNARGALLGNLGINRRRRHARRDKGRCAGNRGVRHNLLNWRRVVGRKQGVEKRAFGTGSQGKRGQQGQKYESHRDKLGDNHDGFNALCIRARGIALEV